MSHLDEGMIHALLDGEIPSAELPPIQAHLGACAECRARLAEEQALLETSDRLIELIDVPAAGAAIAPNAVSAAHRSWPRNLAWAATVALAAGIGYSARGGGPGEPADFRIIPETTVVFRAAESTPSPEPAPSANRAPAEERVTALADRSRKPATEAREQTAAPGPGARADEGTRQPGRDQARAEASLDRAKVLDSLPAAKSAAALAGGATAALQRAESLPRPPAAPAPRAMSQLGAAAKRMAATESNQLAEVVISAVGQAEAKLGSPSPVSLKEAVRQLGGSLRLIDGLVPERLETLGTAVRVVYLTGFGEVVLSQELGNGRLRTYLIVPPGFPADSAEKLRARIRE